MRKLWLFLIVILALTSCRTVKYIDRTVVDSTEIAVPITNTKIEYRDRFLYDSIYVHDSIFTLIKNDTVYISKNKETNRLVNKTDTIIKTDTIKVPVEITKTVTKTETSVNEVNKLYWWQKILISIGGIAFVLIIIYIVLKIKNLYNGRTNCNRWKFTK